ncbi:MAG: hypothetical protein JNN20_17670 [Betaproteobacteria bacterium]|nr:hypothetical protein [Betaproteobacteria bacterium]
MRANQHWHLFCLATTWWTLYFILGLPSNYFQTTATWLIIVFGEILPALALGYFLWRRCSRSPERAWRVATWIAFYMTVPLFAYDYFYLAMHQQRGWAFLHTHWYLTAFYIIPWLMAPPLAWRATRITSAPGSTRLA